MLADLAGELLALAEDDPHMPVQALVHVVSDHGGVRIDRWEAVAVTGLVVRSGFCFLVTDEEDVPLARDIIEDATAEAGLTGS